MSAVHSSPFMVSTDKDEVVPYQDVSHPNGTYYFSAKPSVHWQKQKACFSNNELTCCPLLYNDKLKLTLILQGDQNQTTPSSLLYLIHIIYFSARKLLTELFSQFDLTDAWILSCSNFQSSQVQELFQASRLLSDCHW